MTSPDPSTNPREALQTTGLLLLSTWVVVTCSAAQGRPSMPPLPAALLVLPTPMASSASAVASPPSALASAPALEPSPPPAPILSGLPTPQIAPLARFHGALAALESGVRRDHVRILWLGDSHTAADLWTGEVRRALQHRYGDGGPGFVHVAWHKYRHDKVRTEAHGSWRTEPGDYARLKRYDDGVQGLGGVRQVPKEPGAVATVELRDTVGGEYTWDLAYRLPEGAGLEVSMGDGTARKLSSTPGTLGILHETTRTTGPHRLQVKATHGKPQLLGVVIEASKPGLVLDTVGLNGARVGTFLGWEPSSWEAEVARRKPDLVVLAFGTNESSDPAPKPERYEHSARQLLERLHRAAPGADCLVITPMDRAGPEYPARLTAITQGFSAAAQAAGCATWSALDAMGGFGGMVRWAGEAQPRGSADGVHLTPRGYTSLGNSLVRFLVPSEGSKGGLPLEGKQP
ncbi:MAG: GDSL-type esterase/lipase family protein [Myxococcales bacterium]|nr:GDSL-type esterase/lipase family protein [Polyangiaceae bacterium]MDW8248308.1 GDSL-type esterase/lipase family protein [Myxococcales bacterium]